MTIKTVGFPISPKENENRRAIVPADLKTLKHPECVYVESGFGKVLGIDDEEYEAVGCHICSHEEAIQKDIVCDPKIGDADYLERMHEGQIIYDGAPAAALEEGYLDKAYDIDVKSHL